MRWRKIVNSGQDGLEERVVKIRRCAAVVKGGRRFSFNALVVVGDKTGRVACGYGKANEVPPAVEKAAKDAQETMKRQKSISRGRDDSAPGRRQIRRQPGRDGAGRSGHGRQSGPRRPRRSRSAGIRNILTKTHGSNNPINLVKATIQGLIELRTREEVAALRGVTL